MNAITRITARRADLGDGLYVRRALPSRQRRTVGAWCFLDHAGPVAFAEDRGMHVGAHPHTGLQTFTWLIEGEIVHRDSLGSGQVIRPGQVNLMTAGRGIAHTEDSLADGQRLHAAQLWIALPPDRQDCAPAFAHHPELPQWHQGGALVTLLAGDFAGHRAPAQVYSPLLGLDVASPGMTTVDLPLRPDFEYGVLTLMGTAAIDDEVFPVDDFAYLGKERERLRLRFSDNSRVLLLGGEPLSQPVLMWWNFVGFSRGAIAQAQHQWENGDLRFGQIGDGSAPRLVAPPLPWRD